MPVTGTAGSTSSPTIALPPAAERELRLLPADAMQRMLAELCGWQVGDAENQLAEALMRGMYACWCRSDTDRCEASCVASSR